MRVVMVTEKYSVGAKIHYFRCSKGDFYTKKELVMSNFSDALQKNRWVIGAS